MIKIYKKQIFLILYLVAVWVAFLVLNDSKNDEIKKFEQNNFFNLTKKSNNYLKSLITEKQNATLAVAIALSHNENIIESTITKKIDKSFLQDISSDLNKNTNFKNVWLQIIDKEGFAIQRSWTQNIGDQISKQRIDLQKLLKDPKVATTISVGKFDMTFKSIVPIYDNENNFTGLFEIITHFNSISKKMSEQLNAGTVILADKRYKEQIIFPFTKNFIDDYYVANLDANQKYSDILKNNDIDKLINTFITKDYILFKEENLLLSYYKINDELEKPMGHFFIFHDTSKLDTTKIEDIKNIHNLYFLILIILSSVLFYLTYASEKIKTSEKYKIKMIIYLSMIFLAVSLTLYYIMGKKLSSESQSYKNKVKTDTVTAFNSIYDRNKELADTIFKILLNDKSVLELFKQNKRVELQNRLQNKYDYFKEHLNLRQLHFHTKDSKSFLRMHKPSKFGDSLTDIRESVVYVNKHLKPFDGFEEGRIVNGFRFVYPVIYDGEHLGSVEVSFSAKSFIDKYLQIYDKNKVNLLVYKNIIDKKLFQSEQSSYVQSPVKDFYYDKEILSNLDKNKIASDISRKTKNDFDEISKNILKGEAFTYYFEELKQTVVSIPLKNKLTGQIVGALNIAVNDDFIDKTKNLFLLLYFLTLTGLLFVLIFIYRELLSKQNLKEQKEYVNKILNSQKSLILVTDGQNMINANDAVIDFFEAKSVENFMNEYKCICNFFEKENSDEYLQKEIDGISWIDYLLKNNQKEMSAKIIKPKDKTEHIFKVEIAVFNLQKGFYIVTFFDITNIKNLEKQLIENEKMSSLSQMIGNIAHQWRQPLSIISTAASGLAVQKEYGILSDEELIKTCDTIDKNSQYLSKTIDNFRKYIEGTEQSANIKLNENIKNFVELFEDQLKKENIIVNLDLKEEKQIKTFPNALQESFINIFKNSVEAVGKNPKDQRYINISSEPAEDKVILKFKDNGGGIEESLKTKVFEPYFTTKHQAIGTGLSLHNVYNTIVNGMKGDIKISNIDIEFEHKKYKGACVTVTLPL